MKISPICTYKNNYKNKTSNPIRSQNFKGLQQANLNLFSGLPNGVDLKNPVTGEFDKNYTLLANLLFMYKVEDGSEILNQSVDMKTGKVNLAFIRLLPLVAQVTPQTLKGKVLVGLDKLALDFKTNFKSHNLAGASAKYSNVALLIASFKDKEGSFNKENEKFFFKLISFADKRYEKIGIPLNLLSSMVELCKDENGVVDKNKTKFVIDLLKKEPFYPPVAMYLATYFDIDEEKRDVILNEYNSLNADDSYKIRSFYFFINYCLDKNGDVIPEMKEYYEKLYAANKTVTSEAAFIGAQLGKKAQDFIVENAVKNAQNAYETVYLVRYLSLFSPEIIDDDILNAALDYKEILGTFEGLDDYAYACFIENDEAQEQNEAEFRDDENSVGYFSLDVFDEVLEVLRFQEEFIEKDITLAPVIFGNIFNDKFRIETYPYDDKNTLFAGLMAIKKAYSQQEVKPNFDISKIDKAIDDVINSFFVSKNTIKVTDSIKKEFISQILASHYNKNTQFEDVLMCELDLIKQYGKNGLPLKYSRKDFIEDFNNINCNQETKTAILKLFGATQITCDEAGNIVQFDGILMPEQLYGQVEYEKEAQQLLNKFLFENEIQTLNPELNKYLNLIIKAMPEFISVIGKQQHKTQNYSLDIHMLLALGYCILNPEYHDLAPSDRAVLKFCALLHDIGKKENIVDTGHQYLSSEYVDTISSKFFAHPEIKSRISEFVASHHWLAMYNTDNDTAPLVAFNFRRSKDFDMAKIMAQADLKAVGAEFYDKLEYALKHDNLLLLLQSRAHLMSCVNLYFANSFVNKAKLKNHIQNYNGNNYCVIDLKKVNDDDDVSQFGFKYGTKKQDLKLCVHMVNPDEIDKSLHTLKTIIKPSKPGVLSASLITPNLTRTYKNRKHGLMLSYNTCDILAAKDRNIYSGYRKSLTSILNSLTNDPEMVKIRIRFTHELMNMLGFSDHEDWDYLYAGFYFDYLSKLTSIDDIDPEIEFKIEDVSFSGEDLINALKTLNDEFYDYNGSLHNELLLYLPKIEGVISKSDDLSQLPQELLDFASENSLPIVLI